MLSLEIYDFLNQLNSHILKQLFQIFLFHNFEYLTFHASTSVLYVIEKIYGEDNGILLQYSCLENPMDGGAW